MTKPTALYFTTVRAYPGKAAVVGGHLLSEGEDPTGTRIMLINGGAWGVVGNLPQVAYSMLIRIPPGETKRRLIALGRDGLVREFLPANAGSVDVPITPTEYGYLNEITEVDHVLYVCGVHGQVYRRSNGSWQSMDNGLRKKFDGSHVERRLRSIHGFSSNSIYVCGFEGEIWHWDGQKWTQIDSPTNMPLRCVLCAPDGNAYFCGAAGHLYALLPDRSWEDLSDAQVSKSTLQDMTLFKDRLYIAGDEQLLYLDSKTLKAVPSPQEGRFRAMAIDASNELLWCVGEEDVFSFDGTSWTRYVCPQN
jgi:hypothetical protein